MGKGYSISIGSDTSAAEKGIRTGVIDPLEDAVDVLEELAKESDDSGDKLEKAMRGAQRETDDLADETKKLVAQINEAGHAGRKFGDDFSDGTRKAEDGMEELKDESRQTAREAAASFDGSAESIVDMFQEVAANAFVGFGPAGLAAGLLAAAGIGLATKAVEDGSISTEEYKQKVAELTDAFIEAGGKGEVATDQFISNLKELAKVTDEAELSLTDLYTASRQRIGTYDDLAKALAGTVDNYDELIAKQIEARDETKTAIDVEQQSWRFRQDVIDQLGEQKHAQQDVIDALVEQKSAVEEAKAAEEAWLAAGGEAYEQRAAMVDTINTAYDDAAGAVTDYVNKETGVFDTAAYLTAMRERETALRNYQSTLATSGLTPEAKAFLNEQGVEAAALMLQGYTSGDAATKKELNRIWSEAGKEGSGAVDKEIKATFKTPYEAKVQAKLDAAAAERDLEKLLNKQRTIDIQARIVDREGKPVS